MSTAVRDRRVRSRNPRGQGARLRRELLEAAVRLLDAGVRDDELSLRAVAREAGVAAPSMYAHFSDREEMLIGVAGVLFEELKVRLLDAIKGVEAPAGRLRAMCLAYCAYALERTPHYRALFSRSWHPAPDFPFERFPGMDAFAVLEDAVRECIGLRADQTDVFEGAVRIWSALHGMASLRVTMPRFPWPALGRQVDVLVEDFVGQTKGRDT